MRERAGERERKTEYKIERSEKALLVEYSNRKWKAILIAMCGHISSRHGSIIQNITRMCLQRLRLELNHACSMCAFKRYFRRRPMP